MVDKASYDKIATYRYATMLYFGDKITPDFEKEAFLYEKAAELKNPDAIFALGTMYYRGQGVLKNIGKAIQLYKKAGSLGHQKAKEFLQILCKPKKVTPKEEEIKTGITFFQVKNIDNGEYFAAKISNFIVDEETENNPETLSLFREINLMSLLNHPSILKFVGYSQTDFEGEHNPTIVIEYAPNGSL
ncbi:hypothetical protein M9Y10_019883 [Tritrichomonas musculus]|uniref:Protein kinase domain-containing protein n=1 Tax=Tritrichomonas musculus TaxID=1915356 RepID=A0ABR2HII7_9EUKA